MKIWIRRGVSVLLVIALLLCLQRLVVPKYVSEFAEGGFTAEYYRETMGHQVLMVGDCELYDNFSPAVLWQKYGITSYIRGNAQQLTWQTYYMLREALERETPDVVVVNMLELIYNEPVREEYNRLALDEMRWSKDKLEAIRASGMSDEHILDYIFPLLRYHSRITQLTKDDFTYFTGTGNVQRTPAGYHMRVDVAPYEEDFTEEEFYEEDIEEEEEFYEEDAWEEEESYEEDIEEEPDEEDTEEESYIEDAEEEEEEFCEEEEEDFDEEADTSWDDEPEDFTFGSKAMTYMDQITQLCREKGIRLLLVKAPSLMPVWYDEWEEQARAYAEKNGLDYINFLDLADEIGIDYSEDTYDGGFHMNVTGAEKCADYLGKFLSEEYGLKDMRGDADTAAVWEEKINFYEELKAAQYKELEEYGELINYY